MLNYFYDNGVRLSEPDPNIYYRTFCSYIRLFQPELTFLKLTPEERYTKRLELAKPILDALLALATEHPPKITPKSVLGEKLLLGLAPQKCSILRK